MHSCGSSLCSLFAAAQSQRPQKASAWFAGLASGPRPSPSPPCPPHRTTSATTVPQGWSVDVQINGTLTSTSSYLNSMVLPVCWEAEDAFWKVGRRRVTDWSRGEIGDVVVERGPGGGGGTMAAP
jgi:hypothetical protein